MSDQTKKSHVYPIISFTQNVLDMSIKSQAKLKILAISSGVALYNCIAYQWQ